jgi:hypothetical protein
VSDRTLLEGMAKPDDQAPGKGLSRGYVHVRRVR